MKTSSRIHTILAAGLSAGLAAGTLAAAPATAAQTTCRGVAATVIGVPGVPLSGTADRDVVVTNGASAVNTLAGDDLVCVTGGTPYVETASGSDTVDTVEAGGAAVAVYLGAGTDRFYGGEGPDTVGTHGNGLVDDTDADVILSAGGNDVVLSGAPGAANPDTVDLGDGEDRLLVSGTTGARKGTLSGGRGSDELVLDLSGKAAWVVTNVRGVARRNGKRVHSWTAFERFDLTPSQGSFRFVGTPSNERLDYSDPTGAPVGTASVRMGEGNDVVVAAPQAVGSRWDGGPGRNRFELASTAERITVDLGTERLEKDVPDGSPEATVTAFPDVTLSARNATVRGDARRNTIRLDGCTVRAYGRDGNDRLKRLAGDAYDCRRQTLFIGGNGNDRMWGAETRDRLFGSGGRDFAHGGKGRDKCRAEKRRSCERR